MGLTEIKNWSAIFGFVLSTIAAYISFVSGYPLSWIDPSIWRAWMDIYKGVFGMLLVCLVSITSPTKVRLYSLHENMRFRIKKNGLLQSTLSPRSVVIANHRIYSDWIFIWWLAYTAGLQSAPIVALKKSLQNIPIIGWAMRSLKFLFLSRKWSDDEQNIRNTCNYFAEDRSWPVWLTLFPEGTVFNTSTHARTREFADRASLNPAHVPNQLLIPRIRGLQAILQGLKGSMASLCDVTIVYEPKPPADIATESYFSLKRSFIQGLGPQTVKMHLREFPMTQIPYMESEEVFTQWLYERWIEKDRIYQNLAAGNLEDEFRVEAPVCPNSWLEVYKCFQMPIILVIAARLLWKFALTLRGH